MSAKIYKLTEHPRFQQKVSELPLIAWARKYLALYNCRPSEEELNKIREGLRQAGNPCKVQPEEEL